LINPNSDLENKKSSDAYWSLAVVKAGININQGNGRLRLKWAVTTFEIFM